MFASARARCASLRASGAGAGTSRSGVLSGGGGAATGGDTAGDGTGGQADITLTETLTDGHVLGGTFTLDDLRARTSYGYRELSNISSFKYDLNPDNYGT